SLVCEASPQLLLALVVRLEVRRESLAGELCIERSGQLSLREPSDEGVDGLPSGGVLREPQIQVLLVQVREGELVLVEPVQQEDCGSDVATVGLRGAGSVASALRSAACVLDDVPFREGADDPGLVWGQGFEGGSRPELEPGEGLVAFGEGSGHDEVVPDVAGDRALRQPVEEPMTDLGVLRGEFVEESGRGAGPQPAHDRPGPLRLGERVGKGLERWGDRAIGAGEELGDSVGDGTTGASAVGVDVSGVVTLSAGRVQVRASAAGAAEVPVLRGASRGYAGVAAFDAGSGVASAVVVAGATEGADRVGRGHRLG